MMHRSQIYFSGITSQSQHVHALILTIVTSRKQKQIQRYNVMHFGSLFHGVIFLLENLHNIRAIRMGKTKLQEIEDLSKANLWTSPTLPKINIAPENRPCQKETIVFQPSIFRDMLVSGRVSHTNHLRIKIANKSWSFLTFLATILLMEEIRLTS